MCWKNDFLHTFKGYVEHGDVTNSSGGSMDYSAPFDDYGLVVPQNNSIYLLKLDNQSLTLSFDDYNYNE